MAGSWAPVMYWAVRTTLCSTNAIEGGAIVIPSSDAVSQDALNGTAVDLFNLLRGKRCCPPPFPVVHDQLLRLTDDEGEVVDQAYHRRVVSKLDDGVGIVHGHAVVGEQGVQEGTKHTPLWGPRVEGQCGGDDVAYPHHLGSARQEVQDLVAEGGVQSQGPQLGDELGGDYGVKR